MTLEQREKVARARGLVLAVAMRSTDGASRHVATQAAGLLAEVMPELRDASLAQPDPRPNGSA